MELRRFAAVGDFLDVAEPFLVEREAEHNLMLGVASSLTEAPEAYSGPPYLAVVTDGGRVVAAALQTPPFRLVLSEVDDPRAIGLLAEDSLADELPGVLGPVEHVRAFVEARAALGGPPGWLEMSERIYRLTDVQPMPARRRPCPPGDVRRSRPRHRLGRGIHGAKPLARPIRYRSWTTPTDGWRDVAGASICGRTATSSRWRAPAGGRQTAPGSARSTRHRTLRRRGYASALVAAISQEALDAGCRFCFLFTDQANPTANHIYQAIGYAPVRDVDAYTFGRS